MIHVFEAPPRIVFGSGAAARIGEEAGRWGNRALVVTGRGSARRSGALEQVGGALSAAGLAVTVFDGVEPDPSAETVARGAALARKEGVNVVVGLGGGSAIDAAKAVSLLASNGGAVQDYEEGPPVHPPLPVVAVPTTAGTGSEVTRFSVITDHARRLKVVLGGSYLIPKAAVLDPLLTVSMPPPVTAATGMDALTHAIEAYTSTRARPDTDLLALAAVELIAAHLSRAVHNGADTEARTAMLLGQLRAGLAFSNASVALVHSMSRPLGVRFGLPHGLANAVLLPHVMDFNRPACPGRFARLAEALGEWTAGLSLRRAGLQAVQAVKDLLVDIGLPRTLKEAGADGREDVFAAMAEDALAAVSTRSNPRPATREDVMALYARAFAGDPGPDQEG